MSSSRSAWCRRECAGTRPATVRGASRRRARRGVKPPSESRQPGAQATPPRPVGLAVPRPVDQERLAADLLALDEAPVAAVLRVVAVVAHDEVRAGRHYRRLAAVEIAAVSRGHGGNGTGTDIRLVEEPAVQHYAIVHDLHGVTAHRHDALDEVPRLVVRILEDHDVAALGLAQAREMRVRERELGAIEEFVDEDVVAHEERIHHGAGGNGEGLHAALADDQREEDGDEDGFRVLAEERLPPHGSDDLYGGGSLGPELGAVHGALSS